jgi:hypothetical protein
LGFDIDCFHRRVLLGTELSATSRQLSAFFEKLMPRGLGAASVVAIVTEEYYGQGVLVAAYTAALGHVAVLTPRLVEFTAAHLTGCFLDTIQRLVTDDAGLQFVFGCFQVIWDACLFCHYQEINSLAR